MTDATSWEASGGQTIDDAVVVFVDVRGFTKFAEKNEVFANLEAFVGGFLQTLQNAFPGDRYFFKPLGDGAMIIKPVDMSAIKELARLLRTIARVDSQFDAHCRSFAHQAGEATDLKLGWGIVRGKVKRVGGDYASHNLNKCARLCSVARPFGIAVDLDDFPVLPKSADLKLRTFRLAGIGEVKAWVSPHIASTFLPRESMRETPEVHVAGFAVDDHDPTNLNILIARRSADRSIMPNLWEGCGGQLSSGETFTDGLRRHFRQELGIEVRPQEDIHCFYNIIHQDTPLIPGIRFLCTIYNRPAEIRSPRHSDIRWITEEQLSSMPNTSFVGNMKDEAIGLIRRYKAQQT